MVLLLYEIVSYFKYTNIPKGKVYFSDVGGDDVQD
jgi:hypothetical protein